MVMAADVQVWEVVGGGDKGGVLVRRGKDMSAPKEEARLGPGALVREIAREGNRLHYALLEGTGPKQGWVSTEISNKALLVPSSWKPAESEGSTSEDEVSVRVLDVKEEGEKPRYTLEEILAEVDEVKDVKKPVKAAAKAADAQVASRQQAGSDLLFRSRRDLVPTFGYPGSFDERPPYARFDIREQVCLKVGGFKHGQVVRHNDGNEFVVVGVKPMDGVPRMFFQPTALGRAGAGAFQDLSAKGLRAMLSPVGGGNSHCSLQQVSINGFDDIEDSDEEVVTLCASCRLPLGSFVYRDKEGGKERHGECMASFLLKQMQQDEDLRAKEELQRKTKARKKHDIGWRAEHIPENLEHMRRLGYNRSPQSKDMCCLVLAEADDDASMTVQVSETAEPAGAVNLEYLSIALRCRMDEGMEPAFSLDPTSTSNEPGMTMQKKRFEPEWLAGTSVGEVLFQSDYLLKELSMGEYEQPVVGMRSCFDFSEEEGHESEWRAREWYVVRHANVCVSEDNMLIPEVEMAIEAREQFNGAEGIEDSPITRASHPLVKYAEAFTEKFDLIAERRSAVYHLRELAKACVLAKFLIEGDASLGDLWFHLAGKPSLRTSLVIPQLWTERCHSQVSLEAPGTDVGFGAVRHSVYGGVEFGLDRFSISRPSLASGAMLARGASAQMSRVLGVTSVRQLGPPVPGQALRAGIEAQAHLQGVDLSLANFDLASKPATQKEDGMSGTWGRHAQEPVQGRDFWGGLAKSSAAFSEEDAGLLRLIFNPHLSDRREDGEKFVAPSTSSKHVQKLRELVEKEATVRQSRREHFLSKEFVMGDAGPLFPSGWTSPLEVTRGQVMQRAPGGAAYVSPEHYQKLEGLPVVAEHFKSSQPIFEKAAEDGTRFRIYRCAGLEVRTTQEHDGAEKIGVVYAVSAFVQASMNGQQKAAQANEEVVKATEYVESAATVAQPLSRNFYVVLETRQGSIVVTEMLENGKVRIEANPPALSDRNSRARVVRSADCSRTGVHLQEVYVCREKGLPKEVSRASVSDRKHYAQVAFACAIGKPDTVESGFSGRTAKSLSELQETLGLNQASKSPVRKKGSAFGGVLKL